MHTKKLFWGWSGVPSHSVPLVHVSRDGLGEGGDGVRAGVAVLRRVDGARAGESPVEADGLHRGHTPPTGA